MSQFSSALIRESYGYKGTFYSFISYINLHVAVLFSNAFDSPISSPTLICEAHGFDHHILVEVYHHWLLACFYC